MCCYSVLEPSGVKLLTRWRHASRYVMDTRKQSRNFHKRYLFTSGSFDCLQPGARCLAPRRQAHIIMTALLRRADRHRSTPLTKPGPASPPCQGTSPRPPSRLTAVRGRRGRRVGRPVPLILGSAGRGWPTGAQWPGRGREPGRARRSERTAAAAIVGGIAGRQTRDAARRQALRCPPRDPAAGPPGPGGLQPEHPRPGPAIGPGRIPG